MLTAFCATALCIDVGAEPAATAAVATLTSTPMIGEPTLTVSPSLASS